jgi:opacity protein-like surface antigen
MKLKSLLLGSAAALVAFSGARAADAVIAEPEPVEYVRVCDAYGAGYFYIPGSETCLKIGGFVRYQIDVKKGDKSWEKATQANVSFTAKSETELGTLVGFMELTGEQANRAGTIGAGTVTDPKIAGVVPSTGFFKIDSAYISLGGLKMGYIDNAFDGGIVGEYDDLGGAKANSIQYTFASGGFDATISAEEDGVIETNFVPNVSANAGFSAGAFAVRAFVAYDDKDAGSAGAWSAKLRVGADVTEGGRFEIAAVYGSGATDSWGLSEWSIAAGYQQKVSDKVTVAVNAQYWSDRNFDVAGSPDRWDIGGNVDWTPVENFLVRAQVVYSNDENTTVSAADDFKGFKARLRFQRSF